VTFDPLSAAGAAIDITLQQIFNPARIARIIQYNERDKSNPSIGEFFKTYFKTLFEQEMSQGLAGEIQRLVQSRSVDLLIQLEQNDDSPLYVKTWAHNTLAIWKEWFADQAYEITDETAQRRHYIYMQVKIDDYFKNPKEYKPADAVTIPPGSPIGCYGY